LEKSNEMIVVEIWIAEGADGMVFYIINNAREGRVV
jgi:hypothetical protein